jgi:hypothetical protein
MSRKLELLVSPSFNPSGWQRGKTVTWTKEKGAEKKSNKESRKTGIRFSCLPAFLIQSFPRTERRTGPNHETENLGYQFALTPNPIIS